MAQHGGGIGSRKRIAPVIGALTLAALAAGGLSAAGLVGAGEQDTEWLVAEVEDGAYEPYAAGGHPHATSADAHAAEAQAEMCQDPSYYVLEAAGCPAPEEGTAVASMAAAAGPSEMGAWGDPIELDDWVNGTHSIVLPTGKVLLFSASLRKKGNASRAVLYDPATETGKEVPPPVDERTGLPYNIWCAGQTLLSNGSVLVVGGNGAYVDSAAGTGWKGIPEVFTFNPFDETWTTQPTMVKPRWYPTLVPLEDGRVMIYGGWVDSKAAEPYQKDIEIFTPSADPGGIGSLSAPITSTRNPGLYSPMTVLPDGDVLHAGVREGDVAVLDVDGLGDGTADWHKPRFSIDRRYWGAHAVRYEGPGDFTLVKVGGAAKVDGSDKAVQREVAVIDLENPTAEERLGPPLVTPRAHVNSVILPDGGLLAVGGGIGSGTDERGRTSSLYAEPVFQAELLAPGATAWTPVASQRNPRTYHSTAVLLPDGSVLSAGDDRDGIGTSDADPMEVYRPPYLFGGARPEIAAAPTAVPYGESFRVATDQAASVTRAVLIAPGAVTHSTDMNQRSVVLETAPDGARALTLTAPSDPGVAPPGYYMLFLVDEDGTPSEARFIRLGAGAVASPVPPPAPLPPAPAPPPAPVSPAAPSSPSPAASAPAAAAPTTSTPRTVTPGAARPVTRRPVAVPRVGLRPTLRWKARPRAMRYRVQVLHTIRGRNRPVLTRFTTRRGLRMPARTLRAGGRYTWRVTAYAGRRAAGRAAVLTPRATFTVRP